MSRILDYRMTRRTVLGAGAGLGLGVLLWPSNDATCAAPLATAAASEGAVVKHNMWVWRFDVDGSPQDVLERVRGSGMGVLLKTNEGPDWMSRHDSSPTAISGPRKVREMADFFESAGVPFHAWGVVKGVDVAGEAQIFSEVLDAGARSVVFDLEPREGNHYWQGTRASALAFGEELRRRQPNARLGVAPDARPWQIDAVPTVEFASFCNEILPQAYWRTFDSPANYRFISRLGYAVPAEGVTPELIIDLTADKLAPLGLPVRPIGQGAAPGAEWERFIAHAYRRQMDSVSVWRFGTATNEVWPTMLAMAPAQPAPPPAPVAAAPVEAPAPPPVEAPAVEAAAFAAPTGDAPLAAAVDVRCATK